MNMPVAEYRKLSAQPKRSKRSKYNNTRLVYEGLRFDSKLELRRWRDLEILQKQGEVSNLRRQVRYPIEVNGHHICTYIADHVYDMHGIEVVEDVKGVETDVYKLKRALMFACHGITLREFRKNEVHVCVEHDAPSG